MSKLLPAITGFTCLAWVLGWTVRLTNLPLSEEQPCTAASFHFAISHDHFKHTISDLFFFSFSQEQPLLTDSTQLLLQRVADFLSKNPEVELSLTGIYASPETNSTVYQNLGLARAEAVKSILVQKGAPAGNIHPGHLLSSSLSQLNGRLPVGVFFTFSNGITDGSSPVAAGSGRVKLNKFSQASGDSDLIIHFTQGNSKLNSDSRQKLVKVKNQLKEKPATKVVITGFSEAEEEYKSGVNLAELRALAVRRYLVDHGVRRKQIEIVAKPSVASRKDARMAAVTFQ